MRRPGYPYTGLFLSELAATGRTSVTIACARCEHSRTILLADLISEYGDVVMPDPLAKVTARCPKRTEIGVASRRCPVVYADPVTEAEMEHIRAVRPPDPVRDPRHRRW